MIKKLHLFLIVFTIIQQGNSQNDASSHLVRSSTGVSGASSNLIHNNKTYIIQQSFGQTSPIGKFKNSNYELRQGFIQPNILSKITDENISSNLNVTVYPNPFKEKITLFFTEEIKGSIKVSVFDMLGRLIVEKQYNANATISVVLNQLPEANYILKIRSDKSQLIKKIIKRN